MDKFNDVEKLAIMQAIYSTAAGYVSTKDPDSLRCNVDRAYKELYDATGAKSFEVKINGAKVGTYTVRLSKPKPSEEKVTFEVDSYEELAKWVYDGLSDLAVRFVSMHLKEFAEWYFDDTGELPDGCSLKTTVTAEEQPAYTGGLFKVDAGAIAEAVNSLPEASVKALLLGGDDD